MEHIPVLLKEVLKALTIKKDGLYLDLTLGRAGHSLEIFKRLSQKGKLIGFDKDLEAIEESSLKLRQISTNFELIHNDFKNIKNELLKRNISFGTVDGILIDLGVSSPQLDQASRGFSYNKNARLDMRMNQNQELDAYKVVNEYSLEQLNYIFKNYGEVKKPWVIANNIIKNRPITNTLELVEIIRQSLPAKIVRQKNPAKAIFQAIRIEVNNELDSLKQVLEDAIPFLSIDGSIAIITFHSLEDRLVKQAFKELTKDLYDSKIPIMESKNFSVKTYKPSEEELQINKRSRSAKLRVLTKIKI